MRRLIPALVLSCLFACDRPTVQPDEPDDDLGEGKLDGQGPGGAGDLLGGEEQDPAVVEAEALIAEGKFDQALERIDTAIAEQPAIGRFHFVRGNALTHLNRDSDAQIAYEAAIELAPEDPLAYAALGNLLAFAKDANATDKRAAIAQYQKALKLDPELAAAHQALGTVLLDLGDSQRAIEALDNANRLAGGVETEYLLAQAHKQAGNPEQAIAHAKSAVEYEPGASGVDLRLLYARLLLDADQKDAAVREFEQAAKLVPDAPPLRLEVVRGLIDAGKPEAALVHVEWLVAQVPDELPVIVNYGRVLSALGKTKEAIAQFDAALAKDPNLHAAHVYKIEALVAGKQCKPAKKAYAAFEKLLPDQPEHRALVKARGFLDACK
ncbi:tetratricopeptide repeat protein [Nannocystaceae bacterium ST9]